jgi:predicted transcriptional regulator
LRVLEVIRRASGQGQPGPPPGFSHFHVVRAIYLIADSPGIGRKRLAEALGLGEGVTRTLLSRLKAEGLIETDKAGCFLTGTAKALYSELITKIGRPRVLDIRNTWPYPFSVGIVVRGAADLVRRGLEQRDAAIRAGAKGAMTLVYHSDRLLMPGISDVTAEHPDFASKILEEMKPEEGDAIIVSGAENLHDAENGAVAAALATLGLEHI